MTEYGEWHHDPEHRHQVSGSESDGTELCECGARLVARHEFWNRHDVDLWWWWLPDGTFSEYPDRRPLPAMDDEWQADRL